MKKDEVREHRKQLVTAAEKVMDDYFAQKLDGFTRQGRPAVGKSQLSQFIGVCGEAACPEEIVNYLKYQVGRPNASWSDKLMKALEAGIRPVTDKLADDPTRVLAWQRYATYLSRAFTYNDARNKNARAGHAQS